MLEQWSLVNLCLGEISDNFLTEKDSAAVHPSFSFDAAVLITLTPLLVGIAVHIIPAEIRLSLADLNSYFEANNIRYTFLTTKLGEQFI